MIAKSAIVGPWVAAIALLTGCSLGPAAQSGFEAPGEGDDPSAFRTIPVSVRNQTGIDVSVVSIETWSRTRREPLGTVAAMREEVFQARFTFHGNLRFEIALRGGGGCSSQGTSDLGMSQSINVIILPAIEQRPGEPPTCVCQMSAL